jgi:DNA-binding winged helix-turn-helix (wHTH) protein/Tfp pilus assembly protein PilF
MQSFDNSVEPGKPAKSGNHSGKLWEKCADEGDCPPKCRFGEFEIDPATQRLLLRGEPVALRNRPFQVLLYLLTHRGRLVEQSELLTAIWGNADVYHNALRKAIGSVRSALGDDSQQPRFIETHWGRGYRFIGEVVEIASIPLTAPESVLISTEPSHRATSPNYIRPADELHFFPDSAPPREDTPFRYAGGSHARLPYAKIAAFIAMVALFAGSAMVAGSHQSPVRLVQTLDRVTADSKAPLQAPQEEARRASYHEAQYLLSQRRPESIGQAIQRFEQIVRLDPQSGDAYAGLAECYALGYWGFWKIDPDLAVQMSVVYAQEGVRADPGSAYAHAQLAAALFRQLKIGEAQSEFKRALAIRPNDAEVHHAYGVFLDDTHRADDGIEEMKRAIELEPLSLAYKTDLGMSYYFATRYADAIAQYKSVLTLDPGYIEAHEYLASMYVYQADWKKAKTEYATIDRLRGADVGDFGQLPLRLITEFNTGEERKAMIGVQAILASPSIAHSFSLARIYAQLGMPENALRYLSQVVNSHSPEMFTIPDDPLLSPLHGNPEFETLASQVSAVFTKPIKDGPVQAAALVIPGTLSKR